MTAMKAAERFTYDELKAKSLELHEVIRETLGAEEQELVVLLDSHLKAELEAFEVGTLAVVVREATTPSPDWVQMRLVVDNWDYMLRAFKALARSAEIGNELKRCSVIHDAQEEVIAVLRNRSLIRGDDGAESVNDSLLSEVASRLRQIYVKRMSRLAFNAGVSMEGYSIVKKSKRENEKANRPVNAPLDSGEGDD